MMLRLNRLKIIVETSQGKFGFDERLGNKINFIASKGNTYGKSSCLEAIYYCLGLEELIGGKGIRALKPVFRDKLEYEEEEVNILRSEFYLEIENEENEVKTLYRTALDKVYKEDLIRVFEGNIENVLLGNTKYEDTFVHLNGAATRMRGFHYFLEKFIGLELPDVSTYDGRERKLYLQVLFSALFIEQKKGWGDIFSGLPTYLKIREPKKRVVEYLLNLDSIGISREKQRLKIKEDDLKERWDKLFIELNISLKKYNCELSEVNEVPHFLSKENLNLIKVYKYTDLKEKIELDEYIKMLKKKASELDKKSDLIKDNIDELESRVIEVQETLIKYDELIELEREKLSNERRIVNNLQKNLDRLEDDIQNNKDVHKLEKLGSVNGWDIAKRVCPTCKQKINDILLPQDELIEVMNIEDNIRHLEEQRKLIKFSLETHIINVKNIETNLNSYEKNVVDERRILRSIKNDLYNEDMVMSEASIREKILLEDEIENLISLKTEVKELLNKIYILSKEFLELEGEKAELPEDLYSKEDKIKIKTLKNNFMKNLISYGYSSTTNFEKVEISLDKLLPIINGFDMKFDSSASDNIRAIWAFVVAILQTSIEKGGNHPRILIFDEPAQHNIVPKDMYSFIKSLIDITGSIQCIIGVTIKDEETMKMFENIEDSSYNMILLEEKAIKKI